MASRHDSRNGSPPGCTSCNFVLAVADAVLKSLELSRVGTATYFVLSVQFYRLVGRVDRRVAFVLLPLAALGCLTQGIGVVGSDRDLQRLRSRSSRFSWSRSAISRRDRGSFHGRSASGCSSRASAGAW